MGFLKRNMNGEEIDTSSEVEEQYERMFPKMGRDFVYREDLERALERIMSLLDPTGTAGGYQLDDSGARAKAYEYKQVVDSGQDGSEIYIDLIGMDDEDDSRRGKKKEFIAPISEDDRFIAPISEDDR